MASRRKLRVLALHSFRTSAAIFKDQLTRVGLLPELESLIDIVWVDAPNLASGPIPDDVAPHFQGPYYEWWNAKRDSDGKWTYENSDVSLAFLADVLKLHGPFDGLIGFSQGAAMASLLTGMQRTSLSESNTSTSTDVNSTNASGTNLISKKMGASPPSAAVTAPSSSSAPTPAPPPPRSTTTSSSSNKISLFKDLPQIRFLILFAGIRVRDPRLETFYLNMRKVPSLHIIGDRDPVKGLTNLLIDNFESPVVVRHTRGHVIPPLQGQELEILKGFIETQAAAGEAAAVVGRSAL